MPGTDEFPQLDDDQLPIEEHEDDADDDSDDIDDNDDADENDVDVEDDDSEDDDTDEDDGEEGYEDEKAYLKAQFGEEAAKFDTVDDYVAHLQQQAQKATADDSTLSEDRIAEIVEKTMTEKLGRGGGNNSGDDDQGIGSIDFTSAVDDAVKNGKLKDFSEDQIRDLRSFSEVIEKPLKAQLGKINHLMNAIGNLTMDLKDRTDKIGTQSAQSAWSDFKEQYPGFNQTELDKIKKAHKFGSYLEAAKYAAMDDPVKRKLLAGKKSPSKKGEPKKRTKKGLKFPGFKGGGSGKGGDIEQLAKKYMTRSGELRQAKFDKHFPPTRSGSKKRVGDKILDFILKSMEEEK